MKLIARLYETRPDGSYRVSAPERYRVDWIDTSPRWHPRAIRSLYPTRSVAYAPTLEIARWQAHEIERINATFPGSYRWRIFDRVTRRWIRIAAEDL